MQMQAQKTASSEGDDPSQKNQEFLKTLFPQQTMFMALKLMIIIAQNLTEEQADCLTIIKEVLPADLLKTAFSVEACKDEKLAEIVLHLTGLIHK